MAYNSLCRELERELNEARLALSVIDVWGAMWIDPHQAEEGEDPRDTNPPVWCIGGDFFDATTHNVTQAAIGFAVKQLTDGTKTP